VSTTKQADLTIGSVWTTDELKFGVSKAVLLAPSTVTRLEKANIRGFNVTIFASGAVGVVTGRTSSR